MSSVDGAPESVERGRPPPPAKKKANQKKYDLSSDSSNEEDEMSHYNTNEIMTLVNKQ